MAQYGSAKQTNQHNRRDDSNTKYAHHKVAWFVGADHDGSFMR